MRSVHHDRSPNVRGWLEKPAPRTEHCRICTRRSFACIAEGTVSINLECRYAYMYLPRLPRSARPARNSAAPHTPSARIAVLTPSTDTPMPEQPSDEGELREKKRVLSDVLSDAEDSEPPKKVSKIGTGPSRGPRKTDSEREAALTEDKWAHVVEAHHVQCFGCRKWVKLNKTRKFEWGNWESHRQTCSHISGVKTFRMGRMVNGKITFTLKLVTSVGTSSHSRVPYYVADEPLHNADTVRYPFLPCGATARRDRP